MKCFTTKTLKYFVTIATFSAALTIGSITYTHATPQPFKGESLTETSTKLAKPSITVAQARSSVTGMWACNDGGVYFIRRVGNQMWWYGQSRRDDGSSWSNVFQGTITGNKVTGSWADVPKGKSRNYGEMTLILVGSRIEKISGGQNFSGTVWSR